MNKMELLNAKEIALRVGCSADTIRRIMGRAEFSSLPYTVINQTTYYGNITNEVIEQLQSLINIRRKRVSKKREEETKLMASIKKCWIESIRATSVEDLYQVTVCIGKKEKQTLSYYHNGSTNIIDFVKSHLHSLSRFNRLDENIYNYS